MLIYCSPSISLSSHRQSVIIYCLFSMFVKNFKRPFSQVAFQRFKRELSGNMPHLVSGFKIPRDGSKEVPDSVMLLYASSKLKYNLRKEGTEYLNSVLLWGYVWPLMDRAGASNRWRELLVSAAAPCLLVSEHSSLLAKQPL